MNLYTMTYILAIAAALVSLIAQFRVKSVYKKYSKTDNAGGVTGETAAQRLLESAEVAGVAIVETQDYLGDHYDPATETLHLSTEVFAGKSLSAVGVAAHEAAHAIQRSEGYAPLMARQSFVSVASFSSRFSVPMVLVGVLLMTLGLAGGLGSFLVSLGLLMFTVVVVLSLITLPVEFNASSRALAMLESQDMLTDDELSGAKAVLNAAAWTYIASTISAVITLLHLLSMATGKGRRR